jgi:hypothetical protein
VGKLGHRSGILMKRDKGYKQPAYQDLISSKSGATHNHPRKVGISGNCAKRKCSQCFNLECTHECHKREPK